MTIMNSLRMAAGVAVLASGLATVAFASPSVQVTSSPASGGSMLVDDAGRTLYRYTPDQPNSSTCYGGCAIAWPPLLVDGVPAAADPALAAGLGIAIRDDGAKQLTYQGSPLYYYVGDAQPGDATGQGDDGVWFVIDPAANGG
jgi:predicted lipoprotein with Yx(FWY)xxD motif